MNRVYGYHGAKPAWIRRGNFLKPAGGGSACFGAVRRGRVLFSRHLDGEMLIWGWSSLWPEKTHEMVKMVDNSGWGILLHHKNRQKY